MVKLIGDIHRCVACVARGSLTDQEMDSDNLIIRLMCNKADPFEYSVIVIILHKESRSSNVHISIKRMEWQFVL